MLPSLTMKIMHGDITLSLCISYGSQNKQ